jgi:hypothetical protein
VLQSTSGPGSIGLTLESLFDRNYGKFQNPNPLASDGGGSASKTKQKSKRLAAIFG